MPETCEMPQSNPPPEEIRRILRDNRTIAVVGLSADPGKDSHHVAAYLQQHGYRIIPVNPNQKHLLGETCYPSLRDVPEKIDVVDVFRRPEDVPPIVDDAIAVGAKVVWMQLGIAHSTAAEKARAAGLQVVMNKCLMVEHRAMTAG